jgi:hypothetical protein
MLFAMKIAEPIDAFGGWLLGLMNTMQVVCGGFALGSMLVYFVGGAASDYYHDDHDSGYVYMSKIFKYLILSLTFLLLLIETAYLSNVSLSDLKGLGLKRVPISVYCGASCSVAVWAKWHYGKLHQQIMFTIFSTLLIIPVLIITLATLHAMVATDERLLNIFPVPHHVFCIRPAGGVGTPLLSKSSHTEDPEVPSPNPCFRSVVEANCAVDLRIKDFLTWKFNISLVMSILTSISSAVYLYALKQTYMPGATVILCMEVCLLLQIVSMMQISHFNSTWIKIAERYNSTTNIPVVTFDFVLTNTLVWSVALNGLLTGALLVQQMLIDYNKI